MGDLVKVVLVEDEYVETPWAESLGNSLYRLDNAPFWKYGISLDDIFEAQPDDSGRPAFIRVVKKSGNRTVRIRLQPRADRDPDSQAILDQLVAHGCEYEGMHPGYIVVTVPAKVHLADIVAYIIATGQQWEHADPTYDELHPKDEA